ncbi:uncharacterized protein LOC125618464 [Marmota marmota marmota]|uniref:uncharacterized protein LOC125618464 n=1 Tax=Marmota marmota marmota TaxID=9994 RepID=UPI0020939E9C|nr:uncharacterized protein LOC125618464 [Marmota marmota marmota]
MALQGQSWPVLEFMGIRWFAEGSTPRCSHPVRSAEKTRAATTRLAAAAPLPGSCRPDHLYPRPEHSAASRNTHGAGAATPPLPSTHSHTLFAAVKAVLTHTFSADPASTAVPVAQAPSQHMRVLCGGFSMHPKHLWTRPAHTLSSDLAARGRKATVAFVATSRFLLSRVSGRVRVSGLTGYGATIPPRGRTAISATPRTWPRCDHPFPQAQGLFPAGPLHRGDGLTLCSLLPLTGQGSRPTPQSLPGPCLAVALPHCPQRAFPLASKIGLVFSILGSREVAAAGSENQCDLRIERHLV